MIPETVNGSTGPSDSKAVAQCIMPISMPNRTLAGRTTIHEDGSVVIRFQDPLDADWLAKLAAEGLFMGVSFNYLKTDIEDKPIQLQLGF